MKNIDRRNFIKSSALAGVAGIIANDSTANILAEGLGDSTPAGLSEGDFTFKKNGKFKILQLADTHYIAGDPRSERALKNVNEMLDLEKPDLVIHTGDSIYGGPAEDSIRQIMEPMSQRKIPFAVTFGNHDDEFDKSREELYQILKTIPYCVNSTIEGIFGVTNSFLTLRSSKDNQIKHVFYLFDSNAYSTIEGIETYGHIHFDQIAWYRKTSEAFTKQNYGVPVPSLAFFHIPLPEHKEASKDEDKGYMRGTRMENVASPKINSGMFVSMKEMDDVQAVFVGHDHDSDFAVRWNDMFFIYGRFSGCDTVYNNLKPNGARVIELTEGEQGFRSWIRLSGGKIIQDLQYPGDFKK